MKFSRNPVTGQMEIYTDEGVYVGIMSTFGDSFLQEGKEQAAEDGGPGSGNWGHRGRPGKRGGSGPGGGSQYRGGRSDVGYFSSRGDWLNGLSGEKQHEAIRHIAATKKVMQSRIEAMKAIKAMEIPEDQKAELLKRGKLDKVREDMTPEEYLMQVHPMVTDRKKLVDLMAEARHWPEKAKKLMDENLTDEEKKVVQYLSKKYGAEQSVQPFAAIPDDSGSIISSWPREDAEAWIDLKSKALGGPTSGNPIPDELLYASGAKERPQEAASWPTSDAKNKDWIENTNAQTPFFKSLQQQLERQYFVSFYNFAGNPNMNEAETDMVRRVQSAYGKNGEDKVWNLGKYLRAKDEMLNGGQEKFYKAAQSSLDNRTAVGKLRPEDSAVMCGLLKDLVDESNERNKTKNTVAQIGDIVEGDFLMDKEVPIDVKAAYLGLKAFAMGTPDRNHDGEHYAQKIQEYRIKRAESYKQQKAVSSMTPEQKQKARYPETVAGTSRRSEGDMSFDEADGNRVNPSGGHYNCQTCVYAYEMRRRGYDIEAKNRKEDADSQQTELAKDTTRGWIDPETGKAPKLVRSATPLRNRNQAHKWLESSVKPGERYFLEFCWKGSGAHIVTVERDADGTLQIYDPQNGKTKKGDEITDYFGKIAINSTTRGNWTPAILRVDHLLPRSEYTDTILRKKG